MFFVYGRVSNPQKTKGAKNAWILASQRHMVCFATLLHVSEFTSMFLMCLPARLL